MVRTTLTLLAAAALWAPLGVTQADTLIVDEMQTARASADQRPGRGLSMATVESRWGSPQSRTAAVGDPPITRWVYPGFVVFFEYQHVIHAVNTP